MGEAFVYILRSQTSEKYYIGCSQAPERRLAEHNSGENFSTRGRGPWQLIYRKQFGTLSEARQYETELKMKKSSAYIKWLTSPG